MSPLYVGGEPMNVATALMTSGFQMVPHGYCYLWQPNLVRLHVISDGLTAAAYYSIPINLAIFAAKRQDVPFNRVFWLFAAFIFACGTTHILGIWTIWHPNYWVAGAIKAITALVSVWAALALVDTVQQALNIPELIAIEQANRDLRAEIAERKQVESALQASEANFREMAASVPGAIIRYVLRPDGTDEVSYMSPGCYELWGIEAAIAEQDVRRIWALTEPADLPAMQASIAASARTLETWNHEWRITTPSGQRKWLQARGKPTRQPNGDIVWGTVILDVSDRKIAEQALNAQRHVTQLIAEMTSRFVDVSPTRLDAEIDHALQHIGEITGVDTSYIFKFDEAAQTLSMTHEWCQADCPGQLSLAQNIPFAAFPWSIATLKQREVIHAPWVADLPDAAAIDRASWQRFNVQAVLIVPLMQKSRITGFIGFASFNQAMTWDSEIIRLLQVKGQTIANAQERAQNELQLVISEERLRLALKAANMGIWDWNIVSDRLIWDERMYHLYGIRPEDFSEAYSAWEAGIHPDDILASQAALQQASNGEKAYDTEFRLIWPDSSIRHIKSCAIVQRDAAGQPLRMIGVNQDISERKQAEAERTRLLDVLEASLNEIYLFNGDTLKFEYVNQGALQNVGYSLQQLQQMTLLDIEPRLSAADFDLLLAPLRQGDSPKINFETVHQRADGTCYPVDVHLQLTYHNGQSIFLAVVLDISVRKQAEEQLIYRALHDSLTDLPNRNLLGDRLEKSIQRAQQSPTYHFAVLFLDLDQFKVVNDSLGHLVGDQLLITVARKLQAIARPTDVVARLGGDEFVILVEHVPDIQAVVQIAERILADFEGILTIDGHTFFMSTSIGIVWSTVDYTEVSDLLRDADIAMYRAKAKGRAKYEIFDAEMHTQAVKRLTLEHDLQLAIIQQEFVAHYQPIIDLNTRQLTGFEALIRWQHPLRGFISPADFIPVAEETGLIVPISRWMLRAACEQMATWRQLFPQADDLKISINLSGSDLLQADLIDTIQQVLSQTQVPATALVLEITESMLVQSIETTTDLLHQLRAMGFRISIDDFGTGYSSLSYLYNLPVDYLKIDRSFVSNMQPGNKNYKIVQAIVGLSDQLQIGAIAEGIETEQQLEWLKLLDCELGQGYLLSRPLNPAAATALLAASCSFRQDR